jgi:hypothetical protein
MRQFAVACSDCSCKSVIVVVKCDWDCGLQTITKLGVKIGCFLVPFGPSF